MRTIRNMSVVLATISAGEARGGDRGEHLGRELTIGRFAEPEEIAPNPALLAGPGGTCYVGATLLPNGGDVFI